MPMLSALKIVVLMAAKYSGILALFRRLRPPGLTILCYHGFSDKDLHEFSATMFMRPENFNHRLAWLAAKDFVIIGLQDAVERLHRGALPRRAVVITIDDGWPGVARHAWPILRERQWPATLYVYSERAAAAKPVFPVFLRYLLWRAVQENISLDLSAFGPSAQKCSGQPAKIETVEQMFEYVVGNIGDLKSDQILVDLMQQIVPADQQAAVAAQFTLLGIEALKGLVSEGLDLQLHTHTHRFHGLDEDQVASEINENRRWLEQIVPLRTLVHFCYPSGAYGDHQLDWLRSLGIESATTCGSGINDALTEPLLLRRLVDSDALPHIIFEAEMSGFMPFLRKLLGK